MSNPKARQRAQAIKVLEILEAAGFEARFAGGCVRDRLLGIPPKDYDVASNALPDQVEQVFSEDGYKVAPTGREHGTMTVVTKEGPVEVTTLRQDTDTDGRHAQVDFTGATFETDAARRDFTMNALFEDRHGQIYDFHNGQEDIRRGLIRFVGDPEQRIREDYLRIMRFYRFWARFSLEADSAAAAAIAGNLEGLEQLSQERITSELWGLLQADRPQAAIKAMQEHGVWALVLPEIAEVPESLDQLACLAAKLRPCQRLLGMLLASGLHPLDVQPLGVRLKLPLEETSRIKAGLVFAEALKQSNELTDLKAMELTDQLELSPGTFLQAYYPSLKVFWQNSPILLQRLSEVARVEELKGHLRRAKLPLNGNDVMQHLGISPDEKLGRIIAALRDGYRQERWRSRSEGFAYLDQLEIISET